MISPEFECEICGFKLFLPIIKLKVSYLGLYDDSRFPGRCLLVYQYHCEHFEELQGTELSDFVNDIQTCVSALKNALNINRVNFAVLGNVESHLHVHLIPRSKITDPIPTQAPWAHPEPSSKLPAIILEKLKHDIFFAVESRISFGDALK
jgi:diadenosine tetraphosphate (Ap4A) HIT family hydrolase